MPTTISAVGICNLALNRVGVLVPITSLADGTPASIACLAAYDLCRQELLHDFPWGWASKFSLLTLLSNPNQLATPEFAFAYAYPVDCLHVRRITDAPAAWIAAGTAPPGATWDRDDTNAYPVPFEIGYWSTGVQCIYTDFQGSNGQIACKYTFDQGDTTPFMPEFANILAWRIAMEIAYPLANSEGRRATAAKFFDKYSLEGAAHALNEQQLSAPVYAGNTTSIRARHIG